MPFLIFAVTFGPLIVLACRFNVSERRRTLVVDDWPDTRPVAALRTSNAPVMRRRKSDG